MKIGNILIEAQRVSTAAENLDWIYDDVKDSGRLTENKINKIVTRWFNEIHSKLGTGATSHKALNKLTGLIGFAQLYVKAIKEKDQKTADTSKRIYNKVIKEIKDKFKNIREETAEELLDKHKGFAYELKKSGEKYYIYHLGKNRKAYPKGVKEMSKLNDLVKSWLEKTSLTYNKWSKTLQLALAKRYVRKLKENIKDESR